MLNKVQEEMKSFSCNIKTIESHDELLTYMKSNFYASIKLLIFASRTFSLYWRSILFLTISLSGLIIASTIESIGEQLNAAINISYTAVVLFVLAFLKIIYILYCRKCLIASIEKSKYSMEENKNNKAQ